VALWQSSSVTAVKKKKKNKQRMMKTKAVRSLATVKGGC